jgi:hypothetical protein
MKRWLIKLLRKFGFYGTLDTEKALREKNRKILELEHEVERLRGYVIIEIDPAMKAQAQAQIGTYEPPERTTGPVQGIRKRAMTRQLTENHTLMQHHNEMLKKKAQAGEQDTKTELLPVFPPPRKLHFQRLYAEPDSTFNAL